MILINEDDKQTIYLTRGDEPDGEINKVVIRYPLFNFATEEIEYYNFQLTDEITLKVYEKKGYTKKEVLTKTYKISDLGYINPTDKPEFYITQSDTLKFPLDNKKQTYFYEIILNDTATIIGASDNGTNKIVVYPSVKSDDE